MRRFILKFGQVVSMLAMLAVPAVAGTIMHEGVKCACLCIKLGDTNYCLCACNPPATPAQ